MIAICANIPMCKNHFKGCLLLIHFFKLPIEQHQHWTCLYSFKSLEIIAFKSIAYLPAKHILSNSINTQTMPTPPYKVSQIYFSNLLFLRFISVSHIHHSVYRLLSGKQSFTVGWLNVVWRNIESTTIERGPIAATLIDSIV